MAPISSTAAGDFVNDTASHVSAINAPPFNPWNQTIVIYDSHGIPFEGGIRMYELNQWARYGMRAGIVWGSQIGASIIMVILLLVLTKHDKRRSPIFVLNILALVLSIIRAITNATFYLSEWYSFYTYFSQDDSHVSSSDYANSVTAGIMTLLLLVCIELSLFLQASVVCATHSRPWRITIRISSAMVALTAISSRIALAVWNTKDILNPPVADMGFLPPLANVTSTFSICFFSLVFCGKLGLAIRNRRRLGLKQFGPMQIVFIMAAQTLFIPGLCSIIQFFTNDEIGAMSLTVVAISLPLSSVWASANTNDHHQASRGHDAHHKFLGGLQWKKTPGERKSMATLDSSILSSQAPISPSSRKTTSTYNTDERWMSVEDGRSNNIFEVGKAINKVFP